jgi:hypothetical protein
MSRLSGFRPVKKHVMSDVSTFAEPVIHSRYQRFRRGDIKALKTDWIPYLCVISKTGAKN